MSLSYLVRKTAVAPALTGFGGAGEWRTADELVVGNFHEKSSDHRPHVAVRVLHDKDSLFVQFKVKDRYVRAVQTQYQGSVCGDSCVEFFVQPRQGKGYFNFEINAGGTLLLSFIEDPTRTATGFRKWRSIPREVGGLVEISHSLPTTVDPEIAEPVEWCVEYRLPFVVFDPYLGPVHPNSGDQWRANFYKCADRTSHPHWASWAPLTNGVCNFHQPEFFAPIIFE